MNNQVRGFTVIELLVTLMVVGIVLGVGIPSLTSFFETNRMSAAVNDLVTSMHVARSEAVKRRANVTICASDDWDSENPTCGAGNIADGWIVFVDCDGNPPPPAGVCGIPNGVVDGNDTPIIAAHGPMPEKIAARYDSDAGGQDFLTYGPTGFPRALAGGQAPATNFELCDERGNHDTGNGIAAGRWVQVSITGRPQIFNTVAEVQGTNPLGGC